MSDYHITIVGYADPEKWDAHKFNEVHQEVEPDMRLAHNLCQVLLPVPSHLLDDDTGVDWGDWALANWGTGFGICGTIAHDIWGDDSLLLITCHCEDVPPHLHVLGQILDWLGVQWGLETASVIGLDPQDHSIRTLMKWAKSEVPS